MCDYSFELVASRPAKVGDKLIIDRLPPNQHAWFCFRG